MFPGFPAAATARESTIPNCQSHLEMSPFLCSFSFLVVFLEKYDRFPVHDRYFFTQSVDGGITFRSPNVRVSSVSSNEHDCNGLFPCPAINYFNQQGDYEGLASRGGVSHPIWTDSRRQLESAAGCRTNLLMEEVLTAIVK
jgi:hypothetical protein